MPSALERSCSFPNFTQQAYRYGIALSCIGVLLNWLGVAKAYIEPVRYLGVGLVIVGSFLIIAAMCRWMFLAPHNVQETGGFQNGGNNSDGGSDLHVITVAMGRSPRTANTCSTGNSGTLQSKPPDYFLVTEKPPSYEEAMSMLPPYVSTGPVQLQIDGNLGDFHSPAQSPRDSQHTPVDGATPGGSRSPNARNSQERQRETLAVSESLRKTPSNSSMEASGGVLDYTVVRAVSELRDAQVASTGDKGSTRASPPPQYEELLREIKENEAKENLKVSEKKLKESDMPKNIEVQNEGNNMQEKEKQIRKQDQENIIDDGIKASSNENCTGACDENRIVVIPESNTCTADETRVCDPDVSTSLLDSNLVEETETNLSEESPIYDEPSSSNSSVHSTNNRL